MKSLQTTTEIGIDISDFKLRLVALRGHYGRLTLHSFGEIDLPEGVIINGSIQQPEVLIEHLKNLPKKIHGSHVQSRNVKVGLPEQQTFLSTVPLEGNLSRKEMREASTQHIPFKENEMYFDIEPMKPHHSVAIAAGKKEFIDQYIHLLQSANWKPVGLYVEATAIAQALLHAHPLQDKGNIIIDIGLARTTVIFYVKSSIYFTTSYPSVIQQGNTLDTIKLQSVLTQILNYFTSHFSGLAPLEQIVICGSGAYIVTLREYIQQLSNIAVNVGNPFLNIKPNHLTKKMEHPLSYTTAIGLALLK